MAEGDCADCGGWDIEWMYKCSTHNVEYCRGCECPWCAEEDFEDDYYIDDDGEVTAQTVLPGETFP